MYIFSKFVVSFLGFVYAYIIYFVSPPPPTSVLVTLIHKVKLR